MHYSPPRSVESCIPSSFQSSTRERIFGGLDLCPRFLPPGKPTVALVTILLLKDFGSQNNRPSEHVFIARPSLDIKSHGIVCRAIRPRTSPHFAPPSAAILCDRRELFPAWIPTMLTAVARTQKQALHKPPSNITSPARCHFWDRNRKTLISQIRRSQRGPMGNTAR